MTLLLLIVVLLIGAAISYFFPDVRKFAYFVMAVATLIWGATVLGVLPAQVHFR